MADTIATSPAVPVHNFMKVRLMVMMFLQFFIWGAWYATGGNYMQSHGMGDIIYLAYMVSPIGSIVSPFFMGMIADRYFSVQRVMGVMHILSGIFVMCAPWLGTDIPPPVSTFPFVSHALLYAYRWACFCHCLSPGERQGT